MDKAALCRLAQKARAVLEATAHTNLRGLQGVRLPDSAGVQQERLLHRAAAEGEDALCRDAACRFFLQLCGIRYMEANGFLPYTVLSPAPGRQLPGLLENWLAAQEDTLDRDGLYTRLFQGECARLHGQIPGFFPAPDAMDLLLSLSCRRGAVLLFCREVREDDWRGGAEIVGWLYQFYRTTEKEAAIGAYRGRGNLRDLPAATQFFTNSWVVQYLVQNSLGRIWLESHPDSRLRAEMPYYLDSPQHTPRPPLRPGSLRLLDPCMGSGHMLVYAFELLLKIYMECGVAPRAAAARILESNLWGLDIDPQSCQVAIFALMMKARACDPDIFAKAPVLHLCAVQDSRGIPKSALRYTAAGRDGLQDDMNQLFFAYHGAGQTGSLTDPPRVDLAALQARFAEVRKDRWPGDLFRMQARQRALDRVWPLVQQTEVLKGQYDVIVTNPPYLSRMDRPLRKYIDAHWPQYNNDLFAAFLVRCFGLCRPDGYCGYMTPYVWMFIKSYEPLRNLIASEKSVNSLVQLSYSAFEDATVPVCAFILQNRKEEDPGLYLRLTDFPGGMDTMGGYVRKAAADARQPWCYEARLSDFQQIPGSPFAYWTGGSVARVFRQGAPLGKVADVCNGLFTCDNRRFLRLWWEIAPDRIDFYCGDEQECRQSAHRWFPYNKGGSARKWYGNQDWVIDFADFGADVRAWRLKSGQSAAMTGRQYYFQPSLSWGFVNSSRFSARAYPQGFVFDIAGSSLFPPQEDRLYRLGFLCSSTAFQFLQILNPTLNCQAGDIARLPILEARDRAGVEKLVRENITLSKQDWDDFETSWNFQTHPILAAKETTLRGAQAAWQAKADARFQQVRRNEEAINAHFAALYGTGAPVAVPEESLSVRRADPRRDAESLLSYFVGVWFGRWRCDFWSPPAGHDLLVLDEAACCFASFLEARFGTGAPAELAPLLGSGKPLAVFRRYFTRTFFRAHCRLYRKRPIYWQLTAGRPALLYLHGDLAAGIRQAAAYASEDPALQALAAEPPCFDPDAGVEENFAKLKNVLRPIK